MEVHSEIHSDVMEELWRVKDELSSRFATFKEFFDDLMKDQAERHPELATQVRR